MVVLMHTCNYIQRYISLNSIYNYVNAVDTSKTGSNYSYFSGACGQSCLRPVCPCRGWARSSYPRYGYPRQEKATSSSQTQFVPDPTLTASSVSFAQQRIESELTDKLFTWVYEWITCLTVRTCICDHAVSFSICFQIILVSKLWQWIVNAGRCTLRTLHVHCS